MECNGFVLEREEHIKEINSLAKIFIHKKTKAKLLYLDNEDTNKVFSIGFKTPPKDSTGVMHILEHSVLCGSKKFPSKEPFVELAKGSLNTFLNAMTFPDKTLYPIASQNHKDFFNLMEVYLDAVFYPNIYSKKEILMQEGWHYELENKEDELTYKGVVYNEMQGAFSSPEGILYRKIQETLLPDTIYANESGGDPKHIPDLTYEQFIETHKKYYHPSNSYIYLYGDLDIEKALSFIDSEYLSNYDEKHIEDEIKEQEKYDSMKEFNYSYSISEEDDEKEKVFLSLNYVTGKTLDEEVYTDLSLLEFILLGMNSSPLKKALLESGIAKDVFGSFDSGILQPIFSIVIKGSEEKYKEKFKEVVENTLKDLVKNKIDRKLVEGCLNTFEFRLREADTGSYPKGLVYCMNAMDSWLYGGDPLTNLKYEDRMKFLRDSINDNHFENLIEKYLLNNTHSSLLVLKPEKGLSNKEEIKLKEKLQNYKNSLSQKELENIIEETTRLTKIQSTPDKEEDLEKIPMLDLEDIEKNVEKLELKDISFKGITIKHFDTFTSDISYLTLGFDARCINQDDISYYALFTSLLGKLDTKKYDYKDLANEILINTGELDFKNQVYTQKESDDFKPLFEIESKFMNYKTKETLEIILEIIKNTSFEDNKRIKEILGQIISKMEMIFMQAGHKVATARLNSAFSKNSNYAEKIAGYNFYEFLKDLNNNFDKKIDFVKEKFETIRRTIFNKNNLEVFFTGETKDLEVLKENLNIVYDKLESLDVKIYEYLFTEEDKKEALMIPSNVLYVSKGYNFKNLGYDYKGSMLVLKTILGYEYLWNRVRVQGGAYGAMSQINRNGSIVLVSYRDPNLTQTLNIYDECYKFLENTEISQREMTKYIIGTMSSLDVPLNANGKGSKAFVMYLTGITNEDLQKERDEVLNTNIDDIKSFSKILKEVMEKDLYVVVGDDKKIKENKEIFNNLVNVLN